jgi:hypothetical protein
VLNTYFLSGKCTIFALGSTKYRMFCLRKANYRKGLYYPIVCVLSGVPLRGLRTESFGSMCPTCPANLILLNTISRRAQTMKLLYRHQDLKKRSSCESLTWHREYAFRLADPSVADVRFTDEITCRVEVLSERREFRVGQSQGTPDQRPSSLPPHLQTFCSLVFSLPVITLGSTLWSRSSSK